MKLAWQADIDKHHQSPDANQTTVIQILDKAEQAMIKPGCEAINLV